jgi:uncharacterized OB-fold protein
MRNGIRTGIVYTETIIHAAPEPFLADAPYQIALVEFAPSNRELVRIRGARVLVGDTVIEVLPQNGEPPFPYPVFERQPA